MQDYPNSSILYHYLAADDYELEYKQQALVAENKANLLPQTGEFIDVYKLINAYKK